MKVNHFRSPSEFLQNHTMKIFRKQSDEETPNVLGIKELESKAIS